MEYSSVRELIALAGEGRISDVVLQVEAESTGAAPEAVREKMRAALKVMEESVEAGMSPDMRSNSGMVGGQASLLDAAVRQRRTFGGDRMGRLAARALAVAECNACMGKIVAAPTAGSCGILPAVLLTAREDFGCDEEDLVDALLTAAGIGRVIAARAGIAGAEGGCQEECGTAAAMAAAALVQLRGGGAAACGHAASFVLMNMMGLVCDPVKGLVEVPCVYRNVSGAVNAAAAADMALAGLKSILPPDELIDAMGAVGRLMPESLRETGLGGCAACRLCADE